MENDMFLFHLEDNDNDETAESAPLVKETPNILRQIETDNSGSESADSSNADICSLDAREIGVPTEEAQNEDILAENVQTKIRHRDEDSGSYEAPNFVKNEREKQVSDMPNIHAGAGDFVSKVKDSNNSLLKNVSELGDAGNKNIL